MTATEIQNIAVRLECERSWLAARFQWFWDCEILRAFGVLWRDEWEQP